MAEQTADVVEQTEEQAEASFAAGFDEVTPQAQPAPAPGGEPITEQPQEPEFVQITKKDYDALMASTEKVATMTAQFDKVFGTLGNLQQQQQKLVERVQSQTPSGAAVEITDDDFAELKENFPELAGNTKTALERIFNKAGLRGTGTPASVEVNPERMREVAKQERIRDELEELTDLHPDWRDIVGRPEDGSNEFRQWLSQQPADYQERINNTSSARVTSRAIDRFKEAQRKPATPPPAVDDSRRNRLRDAVQPSGTGTRPSAQRATPEDDFRAGFATG